MIAINQFRLSSAYPRRSTSSLDVVQTHPHIRSDGSMAYFEIWPAPSFIDTLFGAMMHNEVSYGTQAF
jgi:hypothetical protein